MKNFDNIEIPKDGQRITWGGDNLNIPANPIIPVIEGDGIGPDIMNATRRILDAVVEKTYGGDKKIA